jgi:hypothetical protein
MINETCDSCGPSVKAAVTVSTGLTFCAHCARKHGGTVIDVAPDFDVSTGYVIDNSKTPDPEPVSTGACTVDPNFPIDSL